jgi:hypothetical protein
MMRAMLKVTTSHGTYYIVDQETRRAKRIKAENRGDMYNDGEWFHYVSLTALHNGKAYGEIEVGKPMHFILTGHNMYDWRTSTKIVSIEEYEEEPRVKPK